MSGLSRSTHRWSPAERAYTRALALCQQVGDTAPYVHVLMGLRVFRAVRGELALALMEANGERWWAAELYRLQGKLLVAQGGGSQRVTEAEAWLQQALETARQQQAKSLELRAAMSLHRLWLQQGQDTAAHSLLAEISGWFREGFDTADLRLRKGVAFHDGGAFPAEDVKATYQRLLTPPTGVSIPRTPLFAAGCEIKIRDPYVIEFHLREARPEALMMSYGKIRSGWIKLRTRVSLLAGGQHACPCTSIQGAGTSVRPSYYDF